MSEPASISVGIASRYATAIFDLAKEAKSLDSLESDIGSLEAALGDSPEFGALISSPVYSRADQGAAVSAVAKKMMLTDITANALSLMASKRRLFVLPQLLGELRSQIADEKGEVTANVTAAIELTASQSDALAKTLKKTFGKEVKVKVTVDESLIGGLIVKVGSKMIDTSIRSKLNSLQNSMKEVG